MIHCCLFVCLHLDCVLGDDRLYITTPVDIILAEVHNNINVNSALLDMLISKKLENYI